MPIIELTSKFDSFCDKCYISIAKGTTCYYNTDLRKIKCFPKCPEKIVSTAESKYDRHLRPTLLDQIRLYPVFVQLVADSNNVLLQYSEEELAKMFWILKKYLSGEEQAKF